MEALYAKLYNKYSKLKKEKDAQLEGLNREQEEKFLNYVTVAEEIIQHLKTDNDKLREEVDELRSSNDELQIKYQKLLEEENQKNKNLLEEIARLQKIQQNDSSVSTVHEETRKRQRNPHEDTPSEGMPGETSRRLRSSMKRRKSVHDKEGAVVPYLNTELDRPVDQHVYGDKSSDPPSVQQPLCCQRKISHSGGDSTDTMNCVFQYLVELVAGMKFSPLTASDKLCILVHHQSSGYSFSLTWITNRHGEIELLYRVMSLGTFERIAPQWMKETIMFSTSMCRIFFERVSRVIKN